MAGPNVCSIVRSILSAFSNGLEIFDRTKSSKSRRKHQQAALDEEEVRVQSSLQRRPREIRTEYDKSVAKLGHRFEVGDSVSQASLAHTLLILNTGLVKILEAGLSTDSRRRRLSQRSLLDLSEEAALDALQALAQLRTRMTAASQLSLVPDRPKHIDRPRKNSRDVQSSKHPTMEDLGTLMTKNTKSRSERRPKPTPFQKRGGWVKSKSSGSVVTVASSIKPKSSNSPTQRTSSSVPSSKCPSPTLSQSTPLPSYHTCSSEHEIDTAPSAQHRYGYHQHDESQSIPIRQPSMLLVPSDFFTVENQQRAPPRPPKIPLHTRPTGMRPRPPSVATFMTASTKIGEIPERQWANRPRMENELERPLPYVIPPPLEPTLADISVKRKGRGFKFWKRPEVAAAG